MKFNQSSELVNFSFAEICCRVWFLAALSQSSSDETASGLRKTLEFIQLTLQSCRAIRYEAVEQVLLPDGSSAFVRIQFDFDLGEQWLRSNYVVLDRYRAGRIARQELYYDPSAPLESLGAAGTQAPA